MREMKDSGLPWLGLVPASWKYIKLKSYYAFEKGKNAQKYTVDYVGQNEGIYPVYSGQTENEGIMGLIDTFDYDVDECLFSTTVGAKVMTPRVLSGRFSLSQNCLIMKQIKPCNNHYMYYYLHPLFDYEKGSIPSYMQPSLRVDDLKKYGFYIPQLSEQEIIADFIDTKCSEIDALTEDIQSEIDTLEAYKRSIITEAVTKGLDKNVEMKDAGIEWVGEIPSNWEVHPVYCYFSERKNKNYALQEQNLLSLSYGKIIRKDIDTVGGLLPASFNTYNVVEEGDIIIRPTDLQNDKRSLRTGLVKEKGIITSAYIDLAPKRGVNSAYFHYLLHSFDIQKVFYNMGNGVRQGLNYSEFSKLMVFAPSSTEQKAIVEYLNTKCTEIDEIISQKKKQLEVLTDYKKSLSYEYITGKKEVPAV